jgi:glycerol-3-phosphate dehydrogenase
MCKLFGNKVKGPFFSIDCWYLAISTKKEAGRMNQSTHNAARLSKLRDNPRAQVLVIGGGINGIATFRDLALQGVDVVLVEKNDFCSGASAASSHMIHGGVRYLENGEIRLVKESLQERNRLLSAAPHYVKPLKTTMPIFSIFSGLLSAPIRLFTHSSGKPKERGAILIKVGLILYDTFGRNSGTMPRHRFLGKKKSMAEMPSLNKEVKFTATYYDAAMDNPERLALDVLFDGNNAGSNARSFNYLSASGMSGGKTVLTDELTGEKFEFTADVIVNTTGPWTDLTNQALGYPTEYMGGTKGSHIVLDNKELFKACDNREIFFENRDGRIVLMYPILGKVLVGTTDIPHDMHVPAVCTDEEVDYFFKLVAYVFPHVNIDKEQIVFKYSGVRPLAASGDINPGVVSRDYRIVRTSADSEVPVLSLVGGKWTTFRALGEHLSSDILKLLGKSRVVSTEKLPIGGGKDFPTTQQGQDSWAQANGTIVGSARALQLLLRYGTRAKAVIDYIAENPEKMLQHSPAFSDSEVEYLVKNEWVYHLEDLVNRRTNLAFTGSINTAVLQELAAILAKVLGWDSSTSSSEVSGVTLEIGSRK